MKNSFYLDVVFFRNSFVLSLIILNLSETQKKLATKILIDIDQLLFDLQCLFEHTD